MNKQAGSQTMHTVGTAASSAGAYTLYYIRLYICLCVCGYMCVWVYIYVCVCVCVCVCVHT